MSPSDNARPEIRMRFWCFLRLSVKRIKFVISWKYRYIAMSKCLPLCRWARPEQWRLNRRWPAGRRIFERSRFCHSFLHRLWDPRSASRPVFCLCCWCYAVCKNSSETVGKRWEGTRPQAPPFSGDDLPPSSSRLLFVSESPKLNHLNLEKNKEIKPQINRRTRGGIFPRIINSALRAIDY